MLGTVLVSLFMGVGAVLARSAQPGLHTTQGIALKRFDCCLLRRISALLGSLTPPFIKKRLWDGLILNSGF